MPTRPPCGKFIVGAHMSARCWFWFRLLPCFPDAHISTFLSPHSSFHMAPSPYCLAGAHIFTFPAHTRAYIHLPFLLLLHLPPYSSFPMHPEFLLSCRSAYTHPPRAYTPIPPPFLVLLSPPFLPRVLIALEARIYSHSPPVRAHTSTFLPLPPRIYLVP
jgi:hypothetical protein